MLGCLFLLVCLQAQAQGVYLLGEVHDNPQGHALRLSLIEALIAKANSGDKPVIAMEQFDRDKQAVLDQAMLSCPDADCVVRAAGGPGWQWGFYHPIIELALKGNIRIVAANVSGKDTFKIARNGFQSALDPEIIGQFGLDRPLVPGFNEKQRDAIDAGHCRMLPKQALAGMVNAQIARDVWMAKAVRDHSEQTVILLAGNGHVRKDIGVYVWLNASERARGEVHGFVENESVGDALLYDQTHRVEPVVRPDPCAVFKTKPQSRDQQ